MLNLHYPYNHWADMPELPDKDDEGNPLSDEDREAMAFQTAAFGCASYVMAMVIGLLLCLLFGSCATTRYVPVVERHTDTLLYYSSIRDSIYVHDSIHVSERGDTVRIERWHTQWRDREVHDTLYISKTDSVPKPYPVEVIKEVPAELTGWQQFRLSLANILLYTLGLLAVIWVFRKKFLS